MELLAGHTGPRQQRYSNPRQGRPRSGRPVRCSEWLGVATLRCEAFDVRRLFPANEVAAGDSLSMDSEVVAESEEALRENRLVGFAQWWSDEYVKDRDFQIEARPDRHRAHAVSDSLKCGKYATPDSRGRESLQNNTVEHHWHIQACKRIAVGLRNQSARRNLSFRRARRMAGTERCSESSEAEEVDDGRSHVRSVATPNG